MTIKLHIMLITIRILVLLFAIVFVVWLITNCFHNWFWMVRFSHSIGDEVNILFGDDYYLSRIESFNPDYDEIIIRCRGKLYQLNLKEFNERVLRANPEQ